MEVSVSILSKKDNLEEAFDLLNNTSCDYIHIDIMDNTFTDTYSFELSELLTINTRKKLDIHIMSTNLDYQIKEAIKLDPEFITFHVESTNDIEKYIKIIIDTSWRNGNLSHDETHLSIEKNKSETSNTNKG